MMNGVSSGIATVCPVLSSPDRALTSPFKQVREGERIMKKEYKETEYSKKLRDPRWQKKRLEIMQRDDFTCQYCGDKETTLNVHHDYYQRDAQPWEYPDKSLTTLCETCHEYETQELPIARKALTDCLAKHGFGSSFSLTSLREAVDDDCTRECIVMIVGTKGSYIPMIELAKHIAKLLREKKNGES